MKKVVLFVFLLLNTFAYAQCLEITSIFVNSCGPTEGENEMFTFTTGSTALNINDINVNWPNNSFLGWTQNASTATTTTALNATITSSCGYLLEPPGGVIPAGADVIVITSTSISLTDNSFEGLADTMYIIYQTAGNTAGHFANSPSGTRTLSVTISGGCTQTETATYDGAIPNQDGATALFDAAGNVTYTNNGCNAPVVTINPHWNIDNNVCQDYGQINLNSLLSAGATLGGTWTATQGLSNDTMFNPAGILGNVTITYTIPPTGSCTTGADSSIIVVVDTASIGYATQQACDSFLFKGVWYLADAVVTDTITATTTYACDSFAYITIDITSEKIDSSYYTGCGAYTHNGITYTTDTILRDTTTGGSSGGGTTCPELFISEYAEGSSSNKYIEIYNGTGSAVNLADYSLQRYNNGSSTVSYTLPLSGTLADGDVFVVAHASASSTILAAADLTSSITFYNGNDAIGLYKNGVLIDLIGNIGCDPATAWTNGTLSTRDATLVRNANYTTGVTTDPPNSPCTFPTLNASNWTNLGNDTWTDIGMHTANCGSAGGTSTCDSITIVNIVILSSVTNTINITDCDSTQINGTWYFSSTTFNDTLTASNSCDSIITYNVNINSSVATIVTATSCNPADTGIVTQNLTTTTGCDSIHTISTTLLPTATNTIDITDCDSTQINGTWYYGSTTFNDTLTASNSCDSIITYNVNINASETTTATATSCNPADTGVVTQNLTTTNGCDSIHTITTTLLSTITNTINITDCDSTQINGTWYFSSTTFNDTLTASNSCDSIITYNVNINTSVATTATATSCNPADTGVITQNLTTTNGCDSIHTITTTLLSTITNTINITDCDSTQINGTWYFSSTTFNDTLTASNSCDSIITYNVNINSSVTTTATATSCNPADTGVNIQNLITTNGCDSIHTITTTLLSTITNTINITNCDSTQINGTWYFSSTTFNDTLTASNSCDSIITYNVNINTSVATTATATSCNPADTGVNIQNLITTNGCDSIHTITTTLLSTITNTINITDCDSTQINGTWYFSSTTFNDTLTASNSCDSIITYNVNINSSETTTATATSCNPADTGVVTQNLTTTNGCDSIHTITTTLLSTITNTINITDCDSTQVNGTWYFSSTTFNDTLTASNSCDSIITYNVNINSSVATTATATSCNPADTGIVTQNLTTTNGCDSIHTISTTLLSAITNTIDITDCDSTQINGTWYFSSTTFNDTLTASNSCDSIVTYNVSINTSIATTATATSCNPADTGVVTQNLTTTNGCDSIHTITTTLSPTATNTINITDCDSTQINGTWYFSSTTFNDTLTASNSCDSIITYNVSINNCIFCNRQDTIQFCAGDSIFFQNQWHTTAGSFVDTVKGAAGTCDTIVNTILIQNIIPVVHAGEDQSIWAGNSITLTASGANTYSWSTGENTESISVSPTETTTYVLTGINEHNCFATDEVIINVKIKEIVIQIPSAFSPNGNGINEVFRVVNAEDFKNIDLKVYNRWGELLFEGEGEKFGWNGTYKNVKQPIGTYVYYINAVSKHDNKTLNTSGTMQLLR